MKHVFISYSRKDRFFAQLAKIRLEQKGDMEVWLDTESLHAGDDWRRRIEAAIDGADAVLLAMSPASMASDYVIFEFSFALGRYKPLIPVLLEECDVHPALDRHYLDFSNPALSPWSELCITCRNAAEDYEAPAEEELSRDVEPTPSPEDAPPTASPGGLTAEARRVLDYLNDRGFRMVSLERLKEKGLVTGASDTGTLQTIIRENPRTFRHARLKGGKPGLAKL